MQNYALIRDSPPTNVIYLSSLMKIYIYEYSIFIKIELIIYLLEIIFLKGYIL